MTQSRFILLLSFVIAAAGFLIPFWPLTLLGIALLGLLGHPIAAALLALLVDIAYGRPTGMLALLFFPFTLFALTTIAVRAVGKRVLLTRTERDTV